jgi:hypothetical protein
MSSVQIWSDEPKRVYVEWSKSVPHYRVHQVLQVDSHGITHTLQKGYSTEAAALRAAKHLSSKLTKGN